MSKTADAYSAIFALFIAMSSSFSLVAVLCNKGGKNSCDVDFFRKWAKGFWGFMIAWATCSMVVCLIDIYYSVRHPVSMSSFNPFSEPEDTCEWTGIAHNLCVGWPHFDKSTSTAGWSVWKKFFSPGSDPCTLGKAVFFLAFSITVLVFGVRILKALRKRPPSQSIVKTAIILNSILLVLSVYIVAIMIKKYMPKGKTKFKGDFPGSGPSPKKAQAQVAPAQVAPAQAQVAPAPAQVQVAPAQVAPEHEEHPILGKNSFVGDFSSLTNENKFGRRRRRGKVGRSSKRRLRRRDSSKWR